MKNELELTPKQLAERLAAGDSIRLIDIREANEWQFNRIEGAEWIPMNSLPEKLETLGKEEEIVLYCHHASRSLYALRFLRAQGYDKTRHLQGGIDAWSRQVDPDVPTY